MLDLVEGRRLLDARVSALEALMHASKAWKPDAYKEANTHGEATSKWLAWLLDERNAEALLTFVERAQAVLTECYRYFDATADSDMAEKLAEVLNSLTTTAPVDEVRQ